MHALLLDTPAILPPNPQRLLLVHNRTRRRVLSRCDPWKQLHVRVFAHSRAHACAILLLLLLKALTPYRHVL